MNMNFFNKEFLTDYYSGDSYKKLLRWQEIRLKLVKSGAMIAFTYFDQGTEKIEFLDSEYATKWHLDKAMSYDQVKEYFRIQREVHKGGLN